MTEQKVPKKRGRKPKGGRIITKIENHSSVIVPEPNIVLHLKCNINDLQNEKSEKENIQTFKFTNNLQFHENEFNQIIKESVPVITHFKNFFNRNRPVEVLPRLNTLSSVTNKTRSYPSGHAAQSVIIARYVAGKVPKLEKELMKAAYECGYGRVIAGFHYVSDYEVGNLLGEKMYILMNKMDYGQEMNEGKVSFKDFLKN